MLAAVTVTTKAMLLLTTQLQRPPKTKPILQSTEGDTGAHVTCSAGSSEESLNP